MNIILLLATICIAIDSGWKCIKGLFERLEDGSINRPISIILSTIVLCVVVAIEISLYIILLSVIVSLL